MIRPGVAINATVLTATIGIDAGLETHVRAGIAADNRNAGVLVKLCLRGGIIRLVPLRVSLVKSVFEAIGGIFGRATAMNGFTRTHHHDDTTYELSVKIKRAELRQNLFPRGERARRSSWAGNRLRNRRRIPTAFAGSNEISKSSPQCGQVIVKNSLTRQYSLPEFSGGTLILHTHGPRLCVGKLFIS